MFHLVFLRWAFCSSFASICGLPFQLEVLWLPISIRLKTLATSLSKTIAWMVVDSASLGLERAEASPMYLHLMQLSVTT
jgi:hypothetical protein